ncbi:MAG: cyclic nucleotide-binding domain-containing protein [Cyclobacteriaceae bacterium]
MLKSFIAFLGGEPGEEKPILLLLGMGFFMGIFLATYQVGSEALFLTKLGEEYLDIAFFTAGGLGIIATYAFVLLQRKINFSTLVISNLFIIFAFMATTRAAFEFTNYDGDAEGFQILPFIMFVMVGPVTAITLLNFWGLFGRIFDLRASKRIIGGVDTGQLIATILAFYSIPFITRLPFINETYDLLFVASISSFGVLFFTLWVVKDYHINKATKAREEQGELETPGFKGIFKSRFLRLLSFFIIFSMAASVFIEYSFLTATEIFYPDEQELTDFLSFFSGTVIIVSFIIQSFVNDIIIGRFGLKVALMTMPLILILFSVGGIVAGHMYGYETKTDNFIFFFVLMACARAFTASLKDALESPALKLFFLPFDLRIRFDIQTRIEGVISEFATLVAGVMQMALGLLVWFELIHYSYFVLGLAGIVIWLSGRLFAQYKATLKKTLEDKKAELHGEGTRNEENLKNLLIEQTQSKDPELIINGLKFMEKLDPIEFEFRLLDMLGTRFPDVRLFAYQKLEEYLCFESIEIVKKEVETEGDENVLSQGKKTLATLQEALDFKLTDVNIRKYVRSTEADDRVRGARLLARLTEEKHVPYILELLRDINPRVRGAAIITTGKLRRAELHPILVENLHLSTYSNAAMSALALNGISAFHTIDTAFYKTGQYHSTMLRIVQLLGKIGGKEGVDLLWKKIEFPDRQIVSELLLSLSYIGFEAREFQRSRIKLIVESEVSDIAWNIKALEDIPDETETDKLIRDALREEDHQNYSDLFMLLSMIYDAQSVKLVRDSIEAGTTEGITFAVEMFDIFAEEEFKPKVIPALDDLKTSERLEQMVNFYPPEEFSDYHDVLLQIINRDYNRINRYTKALAIYRISQLEGAEVSDTLIANLFNPDPLLLQVTAYTIYTLDKNAYHRHTNRLKPSVKKELDKAIVPPVFRGEDEDYHQRMLLIERVLLLKSIHWFEDISGELVTHLAEAMEEIKVTDGTAIIEKGEAGNAPFYIITKGQVSIEREGESELRTEKMVIGHEKLLATEQFDFTATSDGDCTLLVLRKEELFDLASRYLPVLEAFIDLVNRVEVEEEEEISVADILLSS